MVFPDARGTVKNARSHERKGMYARMVKKGPLYGSLKLKADCLECATVVGFNLTLGSVRKGPLTYDFSEQAIHGLEDFGVDWLKQVNSLNGSLRVGIEILKVRPCRDDELMPGDPSRESQMSSAMARAGGGNSRRSAATQSRRRGC